MDFLEKLGIQEKNLGACTGRRWIGSGSGEEINIYLARGRPRPSRRSSRPPKPITRRWPSRPRRRFCSGGRFPRPSGARRLRKIGLRLREAKDPLGKLVSYEMGKSLQEGLGRSPGDDRHLRFRRGAFAPVVRVHHAFRAPGPSHVRPVPSPGGGGGDHRVQFSRGPVVLERHDRHRLRRSHPLETVVAGPRCPPLP